MTVVPREDLPLRRRVQILSPFRGATPAQQRLHVAYAHAALIDCLERDEAPFAPHLIYPVVLDDSIPRDRERGIAAGLAWLAVASKVVVYADLGVSDGMERELAVARARGLPIETRSIDGWAARNTPAPVTIEEGGRP